MNFDGDTSMPQVTPVFLGGILPVRVSHIKEKWTGPYFHLARSQGAMSLART